MTMQQNLPPVEGLISEPQSDAPVGKDSAFKLTDFLGIIRVRRKIILGTTAMVVALVTIIVLQLTPLYTATAVVMLDRHRSPAADATEAMVPIPPIDQATIQNQVQILTSLELAGRVVDKLKLAQDPEFNPTPGGFRTFVRLLNPLNWLPRSLFDWFKSKPKMDSSGDVPDQVRSAVIHAFLGHLSVGQVGLSTAMTVSFESEDPNKSAWITNAIANAYVEDQLEAKFEATQKATQWLTQRIGELSQQAQAADAAVQQYKAQHHITLNAAGVSVIDQQIADINRQLVDAKSDLAEKQANYQRLAELARTGRAADTSQAQASLLIQNLRTQEAELTNKIADLSAKYGPRHPKMLDLQAQKANLDAKINEEVQRFVASARNSVDVASAHVRSLEDSLHEVEAQGAGQNQATVQLTALQSAAASARAMYEAFLGRLDRTQGQEGIQAPDGRVISKAEVPQYPSFPKKSLAIGLSIPTGLILGLMLAFAVERLDSGFRTTTELESLLGVPVLSTIPEIANHDKVPENAADLVVDRPMSSFAEAVRGLQLGLTLSNIDTRPKVILVTSSVPGEGKTTISLSLARMAARSGLKTVIVDADLRHPSVAGAIGSEKYELGLIEALTGGAALDKCLYKDPRSEAVVLPCVQTPASPADVLSSQAMQWLVAKLKQACDLVIIDSAPMLPVNDTKILSRLADTVLFVVRWEKTPRDATVNAMRSLMDVRAPLAGVALSRANVERFRFYSYGYQDYYKYRKYYHE